MIGAIMIMVIRCLNLLFPDDVSKMKSKYVAAKNKTNPTPYVVTKLKQRVSNFVIVLASIVVPVGIGMNNEQVNINNKITNNCKF